MAGRGGAEGVVEGGLTCVGSELGHEFFFDDVRHEFVGVWFRCTDHGLFCIFPCPPFTLGVGELLSYPLQMVWLALVEDGAYGNGDLLFACLLSLEHQLSRWPGVARYGLLLVAVLEVVRGAVDLGEEELREQGGSLLELADALLDDLLGELFPLLVHGRVLVHGFGALDHVVKQVDDVEAEEHDAHVLLERHAMEIPVGSLQLGVVQVSVVLGKCHKGVDYTLRGESVGEALEVELALLDCLFGILLVISRVVIHVIGDSILAFRLLGGLLLPPLPLLGPNLQVDVLFGVGFENADVGVGEFSRGIKIFKSLVLVGADNVGHGIVGCLFVEQPAQNIVGDFFVFFTPRVGHFLDRKENLGQASHDGRQQLPILVGVGALHVPVEGDEHFLVEDRSHEAETADFVFHGRL